MRQGLEEGREQVEWRGDSWLDFKIPQVPSKTVGMCQRDTSWAMECQENTQALNLTQQRGSATEKQ